MRRLLISTFFLLIAGIALAAPKNQSFQQFLAQMRSKAISQGVRPEVVDEAFANLRAPSRKQIALDRSQPEKRLTYMKYRNTRISKYRIAIGKKRYKKYQSLLESIGRQYGVDPAYIAAIWGIETSYGNYMGNFPVIQSLATLAYDGRRSEFFKRELIYALHILNEGHVHPKHFKGEWAGASGHPQFLPSSWYRYAVDHSGDGKKDIWRNHADVFASIANYLKQNGWQEDQPISVEVRAPRSIPKSLLGKKVEKPLSFWMHEGVRVKAGQHLPVNDAMASLIEPYGGPDFLVFKNFKVLLRYNNSIYYAGSVKYLADSIVGRR